MDPPRSRVSGLDENVLSNRNFERLARHIYAYSGIKMPPSKRTMIEGRLRRCARSVGAATVGLDFKRAIGSSLDEAMRALGERADAPISCAEDIEGVLQSYLAEMAKTYTMAQERSVHQAILQAHSIGDSAPAAAAETPPPEDLDDLLF